LAFSLVSIVEQFGTPFFLSKNGHPVQDVSSIFFDVAVPPFQGGRFLILGWWFLQALTLSELRIFLESSPLDLPGWCFNGQGYFLPPLKILPFSCT